MNLNLGRIGYYFSDRVLFGVNLGDKPQPRVDNSWLNRIFSWAWDTDHPYVQQNSNTVKIFKKYLVERIGNERLQRICSRYQVCLDEKQGYPLLSRDIAKIKVGIKDVWAADIGDGKDAVEFAKTYENLCSDPFPQMKLEGIDPQTISGCARETLARLVFNSFVSDRERLELVSENHEDDFDTFAHNLAARIVKREWEVGMLIPAPKRASDKAKQFYRVDAKLITGEGLVSYVLVPATNDTDLKTIRINRGTAIRNGEIDGSSSLLTDLEKNLGNTAYESGKPYRLYENIPYTVLVGHSLGAAAAQYELVTNREIEEAYLYNGPGVPEALHLKFNEAMRSSQKNLALHIREAHGDFVGKVGGYHLGYEAPERVVVDYRRYHLHPQETRRYDRHVVAPGKMKLAYTLEEDLPKERINQYLNKKVSYWEKAREVIGPCIAYPLRLIRDLFRRVFATRTEENLGLQLGSFENGKYRVRHIRPENLNTKIS